MFRFSFECSDAERVRDTFENIMLRDKPCGKGIFGIDLFGRGVHFKECGETIKGYFIERSENEGVRGSPLHVSFRGRFVEKDNRTFFEVYIYPSLLQALFIIFAYIFAAIELVAFLLWTAVVAFFMFGYVKNIKEASEFFREWVR